MLSSVMVNCCANPYPPGHQVFCFLDNKRNGLLMSHHSLSSALLPWKCPHSLCCCQKSVSWVTPSMSQLWLWDFRMKAQAHSLWNPRSHIISLHTERLGSLTCSMPLRCNSDLFVSRSYAIFRKDSKPFHPLSRIYWHKDCCCLFSLLFVEMKGSICTFLGWAKLDNSTFLKVRSPERHFLPHLLMLRSPVSHVSTPVPPWVTGRRLSAAPFCCFHGQSARGHKSSQVHSRP